jgi:hypothetical protein
MAYVSCNTEREKTTKGMVEQDSQRGGESEG